MASSAGQARSRAGGLRASDADRERVVEQLRRSFEAGRLSEDELAERVETAYSTRTLAQLDSLTADLPTARSSAPRRRALAQSVRIHTTVYAVVNLALIGIWAATGAGYFWPIWPLLGWGIGLGCHAAPLLAHPRRRRSPELERSDRLSLDDGCERRSVDAGSERRSVDEGSESRSVDEGSESRSVDEGSESRSVDEVASTVAVERPSLRPAAAPDGTVTILFSDIEGSTALNERLGDLRWLELLRVHNRLIREQVQACRGFEVKSQGDGFMIAFPSARRAIDCARRIQNAVSRELGGHPDGPVRVRIGLHTGEAIREESDFYGRNVVVAARIADEAQGGEILVSSVVKELSEGAGDIDFENGREVELPGMTGTHAVYTVA